MKTILIVLIVAALVICAVVIFILMNKNKKQNSSDSAVEPSTRNSTTFYISQADVNTSTNTKYLFSGGSSKHINLVSCDDESIIIDIMLNNAITIGRSDESDIVVNFDNTISKKHCALSLSEDKIILEDLRSANKTYINDIEINSPTVVTNGDIIRLGKSKFLLKVIE